MSTNPVNRRSILARLIAYCAAQPVLVIVIFVGLTAWGIFSLRQSSLDAIPDLSDAQVIILTEWPGRSPDLVEDQITYPLTTALLAAPDVKFVRGQSFMGLSFVYVIFEDGTDIYWARSRVLEYLNTVAQKLPDGVVPTLGPDATGVGWVYQYALVDKTGQQDLADLRSVQDFTLRYWLESVDGVAEVASVGGFVKEYQINLDPNLLASYNIDVLQVIDSVRRSNQDAGGRVIDIAGHEHFIRGRGYLRSAQQIEQVVLRVTDEGIPITVGQVATVSIGPAAQRGWTDLNGEGQAVGGIVVMRYGENALAVIERVKQRLEEAKAGLPPGVEIVTTYDRSDLIYRAIDTLRATLVEEMLVVSLIIIIFLLHVRSAIVACITLPVAILLSFIPMYIQGLTANIMSLGGIAVAIGAMVDASIVMIDNIHKNKQRELTEGKTSEGITTLVRAMQEVGPSIFFSLLIITVSFLPVFALEGTEGRLFKPLAYTKTYAMFFAAVLAVTLTPALVALIMKKGWRPRRDHLASLLIPLYQRILIPVVKHPRSSIAIFIIFLGTTIPIARQLNSEFMPPLNEGTILYMPTALPGMSIAEAGRVLQLMDEELKKMPEVETVFGKMGRSTSATDSAPLSMAETVITLKPESQWRDGMNWDKLIAEMDETLRFPGMPNLWWMPIQTRTEMLATGIRSSLGIKVFGDNLEQIETTAVAIEQALQASALTQRYTRSVFAERITGGYFLDFEVDRFQAARYGLNVRDVEERLSAAIGGISVTETIEGRERYSVLVRYARDYRDNIDALERLLVPTKTSGYVPIKQLAAIHFRNGPPMLRNEDGQLVAFVFVDVKDNIGIADYVQLAKQVVAEDVEIPPGFRVAWAGQFTYFERAKERLSILVPITLFLVFFMLYFHRNSLRDTLFVLLTVPFALGGALWLVYLLNFKLSVAVWVGVIAVSGLAAELGLLMLLYLDLAYQEWRRNSAKAADFLPAVLQGAGERIRPMLMTSLTLLIGLTPIMLSDGAGADVMQRIAAPMIGGSIFALLAVLILLPAVFVVWRAPKNTKGSA